MEGRSMNDVHVTQLIAALREIAEELARVRRTLETISTRINR